MTLVKPNYHHSPSAMKRVVDGVEFLTYIFGIGLYTYVSVDGRCEVRRRSRHAGTYVAQVEGHGWIPAGDASPKRFRSERAAMAAAVKLARSLKP